MTGTVVSSSRSTITVRDSSGRYQLFTYSDGATHPARVANGSEVRVTSTAGDEPNVREASEVVVTQAAGTAGQAGSTGSANSASPNVVPPEVRRLERDIERNVRKYRVGVRAGLALDPELVMVGVQAEVGPFFSPNITFRPSVDFGWGEVTSMFAISPEILYRLPVSARNGRWSTYVGVGPGFNLLHQNFTRDQKRIDFGEFHSDTALNILGGMRWRSGMFAEIRTSVYSEPSPTLRLIIGYNF